MSDGDGTSYAVIIEDDIQSNQQIIFYATSGLISWIFCSIFALIFGWYIAQNRKQLSTELIICGGTVILFSWLNGFIVWTIKTNVFIKDAQYVVNYLCAPSLRISACCYGIYRYLLYIFYLLRIRHFFRGTTHEFQRNKFIASFVIITIISFCLIFVMLLCSTPPSIIRNHNGNEYYVICFAALNSELRQEILIFVVVDAFISLYLTWLFVIKARALLALQSLDESSEDDEQDEEIEPLNVNENEMTTTITTTYFVETNGRLKSKSVRRLMLRCVYCGMLSMITTWVHLALRFIGVVNISCIEMLVNSFCVLLSFDIAFCWCLNLRSDS